MTLRKREFLKLAAAAGALPFVGARAARATDKPSAVAFDYAYYNPVSLLLKRRGWLEEELGKDTIGVRWVLRLPLVRIVGSDIAHAVPLTLIAGAGHWWIGSIDWSLLVAIGSHFASRVPDAVLRPALAGTLALVGGRLAL
jgi:hypothetical protein